MTTPTKEPIPKFETETQERAYWESHDSSKHVDWSKAQKVKLPNLHNCITGEVDGNRLVEIYASRDKPPRFLVKSDELVSLIIGGRSLDFYFRHV